MLIIHSEGKYNDYKKKSSSKKPSDYCKSVLKMSDVKSYKFVKEYFLESRKLLDAIEIHKSKSKIPKNEMTLFDIIKFK